MATSYRDYIISAFNEVGYDTPAKKIIEYIKKKHNVEVQKGYVYVVRCEMNKDKDTPKEPTKISKTPSLRNIQAARQFIRTCGGISCARSAINHVIDETLEVQRQYNECQSKIEKLNEIIKNDPSQKSACEKEKKRLTNMMRSYGAICKN